MKCEKDSPFKYDNTKNPVCPYCNEIYDAWEDENDYNLFNEEERQIECLDCDKEYIVECEEIRGYEFSTKKIEEI